MSLQLLTSLRRPVQANAPAASYTYCDSDVISIHICIPAVLATILWVKLSEMFATLMSLKYALMVT